MLYTAIDPLQSTAALLVEHLLGALSRKVTSPDGWFAGARGLFQREQVAFVFKAPSAHHVQRLRHHRSVYAEHKAFVLGRNLLHWQLANPIEIHRWIVSDGAATLTLVAECFEIPRRVSKDKVKRT